MRVALGFKAHSGWAALVALGRAAGDLVVVDRRRIELADPADGEWARQPYHAAEGLPSARAKAVVERGVATARRMAAAELRSAVSRARMRATASSAVASWSVRRCLPGPSTRSWPFTSACIRPKASLYRDVLIHAARTCKLPIVEALEKQICAEAVRRLEAVGVAADRTGVGSQVAGRRAMGQGSEGRGARRDGRLAVDRVDSVRGCPDSRSEIGPYQIVSALAAGGMGEVYRARDTKLDPEVAIKVLPEFFAEDPDRWRDSPAKPGRLPRSITPTSPTFTASKRAAGFAPSSWSSSRAKICPSAWRAGHSPRRGAPDRAPDRRRSRGRARPGHRSSRSEAGEHQGPFRRHGQAPRLRPRQGARDDDGGRHRGGEFAAMTRHAARQGEPGTQRRDPRGRRPTCRRSKPREGRRSARRHLGVWRRALRDAHGPTWLRGRRHLGHARCRADARRGLGGAAGGDAATPSRAASRLPRARSPAASPGYRRSATHHRSVDQRRTRPVSFADHVAGTCRFARCRITPERLAVGHRGDSRCAGWRRCLAEHAPGQRPSDRCRAKAAVKAVGFVALSNDGTRWPMRRVMKAIQLAVRPLSEFDGQRSGHRRRRIPLFSPDDAWIAFTTRRAAGDQEGCLLRRSTGHRRAWRLRQRCGMGW